MVKEGKHVYKYYQRKFTFHSNVGAGGANELFSVYEFLRKLDAKGKMSSGVWYVPEEEFNDFLIGKKYPGLIVKNERKSGVFMLDDFINLYKSDEQKRKYRACYGETFVDSQDLINAMLTSPK